MRLLFMRTMVAICCLASAFSGASILCQDVTSGDQHITIGEKTFPSNLIPACNKPAYTPVPPPPPDAIESALNQRTRYRLVIGVGEYSLSPDMNRDYVDPTAETVDRTLASLGYKPLPSMTGRLGKPYLSGVNASKDNINKAIAELALVTQGTDSGLIYYVGHGNIPPSHNDLTLAVADRIVAPDEGIRLSDVLGTLELSRYIDSVSEIPHFLIVLDACFSGNAALGTDVTVATKENVQRLYAIENNVLPKQIAILAATSDGSLSSAYNLNGTNLSAFGYFFSRALTDDWACADVNSPDGILTLNELTVYLTDRLKRAADQHFTTGLMVPTIQNKDLTAFIAYDASKHFIDGLRPQILSLFIQPNNASQIAAVSLANGVLLPCANAAGCTFQVSKSNAPTFTAMSFNKMKVSNLPPDASILTTSQRFASELAAAPSKSSSIKLGALQGKTKVVSDIRLSVQ